MISSRSAATIAVGTSVNPPTASISCANSGPIGSHGYMDCATAFKESNGVTRITPSRWRSADKRAATPLPMLNPTATIRLLGTRFAAAS